MTVRPGEIMPGNDCDYLISGLVSTRSPKTAAGAPNYINDAIGTWDIRTAPGTESTPGGSSVSSGDLVAVGSGGNYLAEVPYSAALVSGTTYYRRIKLTTTDGGHYYSEKAIVPVDRSGDTPTT